MKYIYKKGFSIVETIVVVAVLVLIISVVLYSLSTLKKSQAMKNAVGDVLSSIDKARSMSFASVNSTTYGVHFQSDKVVVFSGSTYSSSASDNDDINITSPASITNVTLNSLSGTSGDIYFTRLLGVPSKTGSVTITVGTNTKFITIATTGNASVN